MIISYSVPNQTDRTATPDTRNCLTSKNYLISEIKHKTQGGKRQGKSKFCLFVAHTSFVEIQISLITKRETSD